MASTRDPALRPYRVAVYVLVIGFAAFGTLLAVTSILRNLSTADVAPAPVATPGEPLSRADARTCEGRLESLHRELLQRFDGLDDLAAAEGAEGLRTWQGFSRSWLDRLDAVTADCDLDGPGGEGRARLASLRDELAGLHRVYATHGTRLLREDGDLIREAERSLSPRP